MQKVIKKFYNQVQQKLQKKTKQGQNSKKTLCTTKAKTGTGFKILNPKQLLQKLPIALAQIKAGNNSESSLNEIRQIVYSLYQSKKSPQKCTTT